MKAVSCRHDNQRKIFNRNLVFLSVVNGGRIKGHIMGLNRMQFHMVAQVQYEIKVLHFFFPKHVINVISFPKTFRYPWNNPQI